MENKVSDQVDDNKFDEDGCDLSNVTDNKLKLLSLASTRAHDKDKPPAVVMAVPRLRHNIDTLSCLPQSSNPLAVLVRPVRMMVGYLVGDASGGGHGSSFLYAGDGWFDCAHFLPTVWSQDWQVEGNLLRELWIEEVPSDPELLWGLAPQVLHPKPGTTSATHKAHWTDTRCCKQWTWRTL
jgi:hypothetical protein